MTREHVYDRGRQRGRKEREGRKIDRDREERKKR